MYVFFNIILICFKYLSKSELDKKLNYEFLINKI